MASMPAKRLVPSSPASSFPSMWDMGLGSRTSPPDIRFSGLCPLSDKEADPEIVAHRRPARPKSAGVLGSVKDKALTGAQVRVLDRPCARRQLARWAGAKKRTSQAEQRNCEEGRKEKRTCPCPKSRS